MNSKKALALAAAVAVGCATQALAQQQGITDTEIVIGDIMPMSGPPALLGTAHNIGVRVAVAEVNAQGGINGRKVRLISEDDGYVVSRTVQGVRKLINSDKIFAFASFSGSTQGLGALPLAKESGIPVISTASIAEDIYKPVVKNVFALGTEHVLVAEQLTRTMAARYPNKKWAIISQDDEYGELTRAGFEAARKALKLNVVSQNIYKKGQTDFSAEMLKLKEAGAEVFYCGGVISENVAMAKELERIGHKVPMGISYVGRVPATIKMMGTAADAVFTADYVVGEDTPKGKAFLEKVKGLVSEEDFKRVNRFTFTGYAGARVMFEAIKRCGRSPTWACTASQLENMKNFDTGVMMSNVNFSPTSHMSLQQLQLLKADPASASFVSAD